MSARAGSASACADQSAPGGPSAALVRLLPRTAGAIPAGFTLRESATAHAPRAERIKRNDHKWIRFRAAARADSCREAYPHSVKPLPANFRIFADHASVHLTVV